MIVNWYDVVPSSRMGKRSRATAPVFTQSRLDKQDKHELSFVLTQPVLLTLNWQEGIYIDINFDDSGKVILSRGDRSKCRFSLHRYGKNGDKCKVTIRCSQDKKEALVDSINFDPFVSRDFDTYEIKGSTLILDYNL